MTALLFICAIAALFALVLAWEAGRDGTTQALRPAGLLSWFIGGNWPAKAGALLLTIGTGALLRYLMLNIDFPASGKLMTGVLVATALGAGSAALKSQPKRRPIHLALGGAALGVAYLTAYSAYGFFKFVPDVQALGALFIVACGATVFALNSRALSSRPCKIHQPPASDNDMNVRATYDVVAAGKADRLGRADTARTDRATKAPKNDKA